MYRADIPSSHLLSPLSPFSSFRKVRCDGGKPCAFCRNFGSQPCTYVDNSRTTNSASASASSTTSSSSSSLPSTTPTRPPLRAPIPKRKEATTRQVDQSFVDFTAMYLHLQATRSASDSNSSSSSTSHSSGRPHLPHSFQHPAQNSNIHEQVSRYYNPSPSQYVGTLPLGLTDDPSNHTAGMNFSLSATPTTTPRPSSSSSSSFNMSYSSCSPYYQSQGDEPNLNWNQGFVNDSSSSNSNFGLNQTTPLTEPFAMPSSTSYQGVPSSKASSQPTSSDNYPSSISDFILPNHDSTSSVSTSTSLNSSNNSLGLSWLADPIFGRQAAAAATPSQLFDMNYSTATYAPDHSMKAPTTASKSSPSPFVSWSGKGGDQGSRPINPIPPPSAPQPIPSTSKQVSFPMSLANSHLFRRRASFPLLCSPLPSQCQANGLPASENFTISHQGDSKDSTLQGYAPL